MRKVSIIFIFALCTTACAQVAKQERQEMYGEPTMGEVAIPPAITAPDNVRGVSHEKDGKCRFLMGDETKKGLYDQIIYVFDRTNYIVRKGNQYGIANNKADITVKIEYDSISSDQSKSIGFIAKQKGKYGIISSTGETILPIKYNKIIGGNKYHTLVSNNDSETELIFNDNLKSLNIKVDYAEVYQNLTIVKSNGKFGVVKNETIVPFEYDSIFMPKKDPKYSSTYSTYKSNSKKNAIQPLIRSNLPISCLTLQMNNKLGLANSDGKVIYPAENDEVYNVEQFGYYSVKKEKLYGIYFSQSKDKKHTEIELDRITVDGYGAVMASKKQKMGIFNLQGEQITPFEYDNDFISQYSGIGFRISKDKKRGVVDKQGKVIVPPIYDDVSTFTFQNSDVFKVKSGSKYGIVNREGKVIIPVEFEFINDLNNNYVVVTPQKKMGLFDKNGNNVIPVKYKFIARTPTPNSTVLVLNEEDSFNFLDKNNKILLPENVIEYGYVLGEDKLKTPKEEMSLLYVKSKNGKWGLLDEMYGTLNVPMVYDEIIQYTSLREGHNCFSVRIGKKYGLINEKNQELIPVKYDAINLSFAIATTYYNPYSPTNSKPNDFQIVVAKGDKYGTVNLKGEVVIPFQYSFLQRISYNGLFKAKTGKQYQIIDKAGLPITKITFDEVANFEQVENIDENDYNSQALTFKMGKMRVIDSKGNFITSEKPMQPHRGFETFDELKFSLIEALDSKDEDLLKEFVEKVAPSEHILYYLRDNLFEGGSLYTNISFIKEKYFRDLLKFKQFEWNADTSLGHLGYNRASLYVTDYTDYSQSYGVVTNSRTYDQAYGDNRLMEKLLRNAIKINGYWISSYFMTRRFDLR
ncbi:MAG: WG repeat-containing protein [Bacteroidetes bacterium]|nr:WG repeat-containing protein [Bacteroidota bacterium]